ncbi:MAG: extracellular solute-binding protein [Oscillospiraceae bacterium]|nr:extracellular solute-binding protein [Oscillospiraceae bacterium]
MHRLETVFARDVSDFYGNFAFYLTEGEHTLKIEAVKEPIVFGDIKFLPIEELQTYEQYYNYYTSLGYAPATGMTEPIKIQAETPDAKSSPVLSPKYDRSTPNVEPYDGARLKLNVIGEDSFSSAGLWTEYEIENIPADGLYVLTFKSKQSATRGINVARRIYVNGEVPFIEADAFEFEYSSTYYNKTLGNGETPYYVFLKEGTNIIRIESCLGRVADVVSEVNEVLTELNEAYRKIIVITGTSPDPYRDYELQDKLPEVVELFGQKVEQFRSLQERLIAIAGEKSEFTSLLLTFERQMERMHEKPYEIQDEVNNLYNNLASLGTWITNMQEMDISTDYFMIHTDETALPKPDANFFQKIAHEWRCFIASFYNDYSSIGDSVDTGRSITVWMNGGRDQAEILKRMSNSEFTPETGINVNLKLTSVSLINSIVAGIAPDVVLGGGDTVNMALRGALYDLSSFEDFSEVSSWYPKTALVPLSFEGKTYGIPTTGQFEVLFYRADVLEELGVGVPETWDDIYELLPILSRNNMEFGMGTDVGSAGSFAMFLYQQGGTFYNEEGTRAMFDSEVAIASMEQWSEFYSNYGLPLTFNALNRFRSGEMPVFIADYTTYSQISIFAPQIKGLWSWALVPGTAKEDGSIDHSVMLSVNANEIPALAEERGTLDDAWTFLKWFCGADAQVEYARELENLLGPSGRYYPINLDALAQMPWSTSEYELLSKQLDWAKTVPAVPGSYYITRYLNNAFRTSINEGTEIRELLVDYTKDINKEITRKREEFGLATYQE